MGYENLILNRNIDVEEIQKKKRQIWITILRPKQTSTTYIYRLTSNNEIVDGYTDILYDVQTYSDI